MATTMYSETETLIVPKRNRRGRRRDAAPRRSGQLQFGHWWWALPGILLVIAIHYVATAIGGFFAFTDWSGIGDFSWVGLDNFVAIFNDPTQIGAVTNTLFLAFASVILSNVAGLALALGLNRGLKSRYALRVLFFMPVVLSPLAVSYVWKFIFDFNGPINGVLRAMGLDEFAKAWVADPTWAIWTVLIVIVWQNTGFAMVIYMAGLAGRAGGDRGGGCHRRRQPVAAVLERHAARRSAPPSRSRRRSASSTASASSTRSWR